MVGRGPPLRFDIFLYEPSTFFGTWRALFIQDHSPLNMANSLHIHAQINHSFPPYFEPFVCAFFQEFLLQMFCKNIQESKFLCLHFPVSETL